MALTTVHPRAAGGKSPRSVSTDDKQQAEPALVRPPHASDIADILRRLQSSPEGLSSAEAQKRLERYGPNILPRTGGDSALKLLARQIHNPLIYVLLVSSILAILLGKPLDGAVVLGVVIINTIIGFLQEYRAGRAIEALIDMVPENARVLRDGARVSLPAAQLVPGDIISLASGDKVPADLRLMSVRNLRVDESPLTGESVPVEKTVATVNADAGIGDRTNSGFNGTLVTYGTGEGVVVSTGLNTELGRISGMLQQATDLQTPLTRTLATVGKIITVAILAVSALLFVVGRLNGYTYIDAALAAITLAVAAIPEGLPAIVTIALAIGVRRMARRRAVIRKLPAVETLGSTTVICSDKTGTLTRNEMTAKALWTPQHEWSIEGVGYQPEGAIVGNAPLPHDLLLAAALCNDSDLRQEGHGRWTISGDPTEAALVVAARKAGINEITQRRQLVRISAVPFESERQFMATLHRREPAGELIAFMKGAPEVVLRRCGNVHRMAALAAVERLAAQGMRVLAVASRPMPPGQTDLDENQLDSFHFLGLVGMIDPPRQEAIDAVRACHQAGIVVKMITGDHAVTAEAIGRHLGLLQRAQDRALTGAALASMDEEALRQAARQTNVFARVAPEHKLRLVKALQAERNVVAMTGDGVNDAPALKQSDIGVAMGITGTAVSKESADVVLTDDNFASIRAAVEEGRRVYDNLIKSLAFVLPTNLGLALILLAAVIFFPTINGVPILPMEPVQILWINLVATVALALPLVMEAMEPNVMRRPPRKPDAPVFSAFVILRTVIVGVLMAAGGIGLFLYEYHVEKPLVGHELALAEAQTMAVTTVILFQIFYLLNCRSLRDSIVKIGLFSNPSIFAGILALLAMQLAFIYVPFMNALFGSAGLNADAWMKSVLVAAIVLPVISAEKWLRRRTERHAGPLSPPGAAG
jgi:calcium-translocating P-type ATPase